MVVGSLGIILLMLWLYLDFSKEDPDTTNVSISFSDQSATSTDPSIKLFVDGKLVYQADSMHKSRAVDLHLTLKQGQHLFQASTAEGKYLSSDTIEIRRVLDKNRISVQFEYHPPIEEYITYISKFLYQRALKRQDYNEVEKKALRDKIHQAVKQTPKLRNYQESPGKFSFTLNPEEEIKI